MLCPTKSVDRVKRCAGMLKHYYNQQREEGIQAGDLFWIVAQRANDGLAQELREAGIRDLEVIGDAFAPRRFRHAMAEGYRAGLTV